MGRLRSCATMIGAMLLAGACSSSSSTTTAPTQTSSPTTTVDAANLVIHGERYCEVLAITKLAPAVADVYNSFPMNRCPQDQWGALDTKAIAKQLSVPLAVLNGPRFWLMDHIEQSAKDAVEPTRADFGGIEMVKRATVEIGSLVENAKPYTIHEVNRAARFSYEKGSTVFELYATDGSVFVMQSYSTQKDSTLTEATLGRLGDKLALPQGWTFGSRVLDSLLVVDTRSRPARVLQDELGNSYSMETTG
jgi:hypothetical protein